VTPSTERAATATTLARDDHWRLSLHYLVCTAPRTAHCRMPAALLCGRLLALSQRLPCVWILHPLRRWCAVLASSVRAAASSAILSLSRDAVHPPATLLLILPLREAWCKKETLVACRPPASTQTGCPYLQRVRVPAGPPRRLRAVAHLALFKPCLGKAGTHSCPFIAPFICC
jgi:hypothetical protein